MIAYNFMEIFDNYAPNFEKVGGAYCLWSVRACVTLFVPTVTFKPLKLESWNLICGFLIKIADPYIFSFLSYLHFWSYGPLKSFEKNLVSRLSQKVFKLEA